MWNSYFNICVLALCAVVEILFKRCDQEKKKKTEQELHCLGEGIDHCILVKGWVLSFALQWWQGARGSCCCVLAAQPQLQDRQSDQLQFRQLNSSDLHKLMSWCSSWVIQESPVQVGKTFKGALWTLFLFSLLEIITPLKMWKSSKWNSEIWLNSVITSMSRR